MRPASVLRSIAIIIAVLVGADEYCPCHNADPDLMYYHAKRNMTTVPLQLCLDVSSLGFHQVFDRLGHDGVDGVVTLFSKMNRDRSSLMANSQVASMLLLDITSKDVDFMATCNSIIRISATGLESSFQSKQVLCPSLCSPLPDVTFSANILGGLLHGNTTHMNGVSITCSMTTDMLLSATKMVASVSARAATIFHVIFWR